MDTNYVTDSNNTNAGEHNGIFLTCFTKWFNDMGWGVGNNVNIHTCFWKNMNLHSYLFRCNCSCAKFIWPYVFRNALRQWSIEYPVLYSVSCLMKSILQLCFQIVLLFWSIGCNKTKCKGFIKILIVNKSDVKQTKSFTNKLLFQSQPSTYMAVHSTDKESPDLWMRQFLGFLCRDVVDAHT